MEEQQSWRNNLTDGTEFKSRNSVPKEIYHNNQILFVKHSRKSYLQREHDINTLQLVVNCVLPLFNPALETVIMHSKQLTSWEAKHINTHIVLPVLLLQITIVWAAFPLSPVLLSCLARISVFHITENRRMWFHTDKFPFLLSGSGAGDFLSDRVRTVLLLLQANVAGPDHTGRYTLQYMFVVMCNFLHSYITPYTPTVEGINPLKALFSLVCHAGLHKHPGNWVTVLPS